MFREASQNRIFQDVVNQIQDAILDGRLKNGDILPPERELKEMFNTSRGTLREALRVLEERGLIEIRLGVRGGSIVKTLTTQHASQTLALLIRSQMVSIKQLSEFREGIEGTVASMAAQRADSADKKQLNTLLQKAREIVEQEPVDRESFIESDRRIHLELANISRNSLLVWPAMEVFSSVRLIRYGSTLLTGPYGKYLATLYPSAARLKLIWSLIPNNCEK